MSGSPLLINADLSQIRDSSLQILRNEEIIEASKTLVGSLKCSKNCDMWSRTMRYPQVYSRYLSDGDVVAVIVNWLDKPFNEFWFEFKDIGLKKWGDDILNVRDIGAQKEIGNYREAQTHGTSILINHLEAHESKIYRFNLVN
jgi:hypothetical protein